MCVRIINSGLETKYDARRPLEEQVVGAQKIVINYDPKDAAIDHFLLDMKRLCNTGISTDIKVDVNTNNFLNGMQVKRQVRRLTKDLNVNELIKLLTTLQSKTNKALEELSSFCNK